MAPAVFAAGDHALMPEDHLWGPRDYYKSRFYTESTAHFISEIGYHGCPCVESLEEFLPPDALWPWRGNEAWRIHAADTWPEPGPYACRIELMAKQVREAFGIEPSSLEEFVLASQICQAEAKKFFIEMVRLAKWRRTGVLWWNVMDCWPQFSDAVVDYYFRRKLACLYIQRVQRPACVMMAEPESWACRVVLGNDSRRAVRGTFAIRDADTGAVLLEGPAEAGPNENRTLGSVPASRGEQRMFLIDWDLDGEAGRNHYLLGTPPFDLARYRAWLPKLLPCDVETLVRHGLP
jgi:beta-mannosidase